MVSAQHKTQGMSGAKISLASMCPHTLLLKYSQEMSLYLICCPVGEPFCNLSAWSGTFSWFAQSCSLSSWVGDFASISYFSKQKVLQYCHSSFALDSPREFSIGLDRPTCELVGSKLDFQNYLVQTASQTSKFFFNFSHETNLLLIWEL